MVNKLTVNDNDVKIWNLKTLKDESWQLQWSSWSNTTSEGNRNGESENNALGTVAFNFEWNSTGKYF